MIKNKNEKMCSFYVSKNHLITILMAYLKENLKEYKKLNVIVEDNFKEEVDKIIEKMNIEKDIKMKILKANWKKAEKPVHKMKKGLVIVEGDMEYIENINNILGKNMKIELLNCYRFEDFKNNSRKILEEHNYIINTLGKSKIPDIFDKKIEKREILTK